MMCRGGEPITTLLARCRELRRQRPTPRRCSGLLRGRQLAGAKFRRQHQFGRYILDVYCHSRRLVIEVDGAHHAGQRDLDAARTRELEAAGLQVMRFMNREVLTETESVLERIWEVVEPSPLPSPRGSAPSPLPSPRGSVPSPRLLPGGEGSARSERERG